MEIHAEGSATGRQSRTCEEAGLCRDDRFGGFDAEEEEEIVCRHHCGCDVHASTQWKAEGHTSLSPEQITAERQREESS